MKRITFIIGILVAMLALQGCGVTPVATQASNTPGLAPAIKTSRNSGSLTGASVAINRNAVAALCPGSSTASFEEEVITRTNAERTKAGVAALTKNSQLTDAAQGHTIYMACNYKIEHTETSGLYGFTFSDLGERVDAQNYLWTNIGENVAAGQATPEAVVAAWMASLDHKANILNADFKEIGVGYVSKPGGTTYNYTHYWTQVFATK